MGCASSTYLTPTTAEDAFNQVSCSTRHHIVSLTSSTNGLLTLDLPSPHPPSSSSSFDLFPTTALHHLASTTSTPNPNSPTLGTSTPTPAPPGQSFRLSAPPLKPNEENSNPILARPLRAFSSPTNSMAPKVSSAADSCSSSLDMLENICPPNGASKVVIYATTLRAVRKTFESCNAVRSAFKGFRIPISERDISMHQRFREELRELLKGKPNSELTLLRVFVKGRYIGGVEEVMRLLEDGGLSDFLQGLPKLSKAGRVCDTCGGARILPYFKCNGSCKIVVEELDSNEEERSVVVRCS